MPPRFQRVSVIGGAVDPPPPTPSPGPWTLGSGMFL